MRIITKFKDFYDTSAGYGINKEIIYKRFTKNVLINVEQYNSWEKKKSEINFGKYSIIGFCGEIFPIINLRVPSNLNKEDLRLYEDVLYNQEAIKYQIRSTSLSWDRFKDTSKSSFIEDNFYNKKSFRNFGNPKETYENLQNNQRLCNLFYELNTPIFFINNIKGATRKIEVTINPNLKFFAFNKIKNSVLVFSNIEQFLSNQLININNKPIQVNNEILALSKGFNENSFKKDKSKQHYGKRKRRRKI